MENKNKLKIISFIAVTVLPAICFANDGGDGFKVIFDFVYKNLVEDAYLTKVISLVGFAAGMGIAAFTGKAVAAVGGIIFGVVGALGPKVILSFFG